MGSFDSDGIKGTTYSLPLYAKFKLSQRVGLGFSIPLSYMDIEGASVFGAGMIIGLPVKILMRDENSAWTWQVTPSGGGLASGSKDMLAGGIVSQYGLSSMLSYDFENFTLTMGNTLQFFEGVPVTFGEIEFDPNVSQQILKNGAMIGIPFKQNWVTSLYAIHTKFLEKAAVDQYITVGGELGWKPNPLKRRYWKIGVFADIGDSFTSAHAQFGTAWKF